MKNSEVALLIPAYQPSDRLQVLLEALAQQGASVFSRIVVVNDGSGKQFDPVFNTVSNSFPNLTVLEHGANLGKGAALKTGFNFILSTGNEDAIVTADADGQHAPDDILAIAKTSVSNPNALILGVRKFDPDIPLRSLLGNRITCFVMKLITGLEVSDTQTGLRAWPRKLASNALGIPINGYDFEMEALVRSPQVISKKDLILVPISTIYLDGNKSSHFNPLIDSMRIYFVFLRFCGAGLLTALVDNLIFITAYKINHDILVSQVLSRFSGALFSFWMSRNVVFASQANWPFALTKFFSLVVLLGFISYGMIAFMTTQLGLGVIISKLLAELLLFVGSFAVQREFIFNDRSYQAASRL